MVNRKTNRQNITTIKLEKETKARLCRLKEHERETFDQVIKKILYVLNRIRKDPISGNQLLSKIDANITRKQIFDKQINHFKQPKNLKQGEKATED